jgi:chromosome segregation and condensation protein ScpB
MADLKQILTQATSLDTFKRTEAMQLLERWEQEPAYHHALTTIYMDIHNSHKIRSLAIICMKNGVQKYWRKTAKHCIQPLEKQQIRESLMQYFSEGNRQVRLNNVVGYSTGSSYF